MHNSAAADNDEPVSRPGQGGVLVTVVLPARNEELLLPRSLGSLARMESGGLDVEVIVVDNASTDRTAAIAQSFGAKVVRSGGRTIAGVRNDGAQHARGSTLAFLDADCEVDRDWLSRALRHFDAPGVVAVGSYPAAPADAAWLPRTWSFLVRRAERSAVEVAWLASANLLVRASAFWRVGGFDPRLESCEDTDLSYRLRDIGVLIYDPEVRAIHHREPVSLQEFFTREVWHGKNSYRGGRVVREELASLVLPIVAAAGIIASQFGLVRALRHGDCRLFSMGIVTLMLPAVLCTVRAIAQKGRPLQAPVFLLVYLTYSLARATALARGLLHVAKRVVSGSSCPTTACTQGEPADREESPGIDAR